MKTGTTWSAGRVGSEMWVDRKTAAERVEITRRERAMERSGRWKSGNWAVKKRAKRMRRVTKRIQTWAETTSCHTNNKTKFTLLINMLVLVSSNIHTILCLFFLLYFEKEGIILQAYRWFMELQWFMIPESEWLLRRRMSGRRRSCDCYTIRTPTPVPRTRNRNQSRDTTRLRFDSDSNATAKSESESDHDANSDVCTIKGVGMRVRTAIKYRL